MTSIDVTRSKSLFFKTCEQCTCTLTKSFPKTHCIRRYKRKACFAHVKYLQCLKCMISLYRSFHYGNVLTNILNPHCIYSTQLSAPHRFYCQVLISFWESTVSAGCWTRFKKLWNNVILNFSAIFAQNEGTSAFLRGVPFSENLIAVSAISFSSSGEITGRLPFSGTETWMSAFDSSRLFGLLNGPFSVRFL